MHKPEHIISSKDIHFDALDLTLFDVFKFFSRMKTIELQIKFIEISSLGSNKQYVNIGLDDGMALTSQQVILWPNDDPVPQCIYV